MLIWIHLLFIIIIFTIILFQSNNPPISISSSGSSTFAGAYCTGLSSTLAYVTGADAY